MRLITAQIWLERYFEEGSRPADLTLQRWLRSGKIPGKKVGDLGTLTNMRGWPRAMTWSSAC